MQAGTGRAVAVSPRERGLSREKLGRAALEIVDREGLRSLSMRRLADELGVGKMTLYGHVRSKDELLDAVIDAAVAEREIPVRNGPWRQQLGELMRRSHRNLTAHPALVSIRLERPVVRPDALRFGEAGMAILQGAGFDAEEAARAFRLLYTYVVGYAGLSPAARVDESRRMAAVAIAGLDPNEYPNLTDAAAAFSAAMAGEEQFEYGLECILDGLEARLAELSPP